MRKRIVALIVALLTLLFIFTSCKTNNGEGLLADPTTPVDTDENHVNANATGFVYVPSISTIKLEQGGYNTITYDGCVYYFSQSETAIHDEDGDAENTLIEQRLYRASVETGAVTEVEAYRPSEPPEGYENTEGGYFVNQFISGGNGTALINEYGSFGSYDMENERFDGITVSKMRIIKLTGEEVAVLDFESAGINESFYAQFAVMDKDGNVVLGGQDENSVEPALYIFAPDGSFSFDVAPDRWINDLITLPDGRVAIATETVASGLGNEIKPINLTSKTIGASLGALPYNVRQIDGTDEDGKLYYHTEAALFTIKLGDKDAETAVSWLDADVDGGNIRSVSITGDDIVLVGNNFTASGVELIITKLKKTFASEVKPKTVLTLACMNIDYDNNLRSLILNFNRTDPDYRIQVKDYSVYNTENDLQAGRMVMNTEIIAGNVPDILSANAYDVPINTFINKGVFEDLYPYLDSDIELGGRSAVVQAVLNTLEDNNGALMRVAGGFSIVTAIGNSDYIGKGNGITLEETLTALSKAKPSTMIFDSSANRQIIMNMLYTYTIQSYINWDTGIVDFTSPQFIEYIEFAKTFPENGDYTQQQNPMLALLNGELLLYPEAMTSFHEMAVYNAVLEGKAVVKGFPCEDRNGSALNLVSPLAMGSTSVHKEGAWRFIRQVLKEGYMYDSSGVNLYYKLSGFPSNQKDFNAMAESAMMDLHEGDTPFEREYFSNGGWSEGGLGVPDPENFGNPVIPRGYILLNSGTNSYRAGGSSLADAPDVIKVYAMTKTEYDEFVSFLNTISRTIEYDETIQKIINEELEPFFAGQKTAQMVCDIIQGRASIYVNEQR